MNDVHLSGVLPGRRAEARPERENDMIVTPSAPSSGRIIVRLTGGLDLAAAPALREQLIDVVHRGTGVLVVDLSCIQSCDAAGLAVLVGTQRRARLFGTMMRLLAPSPAVTKVLRSTGLERSFTIEASDRGMASG
jgi:anti-anti-sigma factor